MKNDSSQSGWWGKGAAVVVVLVLGGVAAAPYLVAASKGLVTDGKLSVDRVVKEAQGEMRKNRSEMDKFKDSEIKAAAWSADGQLYVGSKNGLAVLKDGKSVPVADFPADEAKAIACAADGNVWVAGKKGLHLLKGGKWTTEKQGDLFSVSVTPSSVVAVGKKGIYSRDASGKWSELMAAPPEPKKEHGGEEKENHEKRERAEKEYGKNKH
jgi:hypothetical protein